MAHSLQQEYEDLHFHVISGDTADLVDRLDKGLFDVCLLLGEIDQSKYEYLTLPYRDTWGVLMRSDTPLAQKNMVAAADLWDKPLILSRQAIHFPQFTRWFQKPVSELNITATYNLAFNASMMAKQNMGVCSHDRRADQYGRHRALLLPAHAAAQHRNVDGVEEVSDAVRCGRKVY